MNFIKKLLAMRNAFGLVIIGLLFLILGLVIIFAGNPEDIVFPLVFAGIGAVALAAGVLQVVKELKSPVSDKAQYDRVNPAEAEAKKAMYQPDPNEPVEEFVFHYTGHMNQSKVMKTMEGEVVFEAICDKMTMIKDTEFRFVNHLTGDERVRMIGHTVTNSAGVGAGVSANLSSTFKVDGVSVWDVIAADGYSFRFSMSGLSAHYEVERYKENVGSAETAGTGLMNPKYANNPLGKVPSKEIYRVRCKRSDVPAFFMICFALSRTEMTVS